MSKLVLAVLMFFGTTLCWADPVHRSNLQDACAPEHEQNQWEQEEQEIEEQQFFEQLRAERAVQRAIQRAQREVITTTTVNNEITEQIRLTEIIIRMEAETDVRVMGLTERQQRVVIRTRQITAGARIIEQNLLTIEQTPEQRLAELTPRTGELRARIARLELQRTPEWRAEQERLRPEQERQIAVGLEFQARQRQAARMMEEVERLRENGWTMGCSVM